MERQGAHDAGIDMNRPLRNPRGTSAPARRHDFRPSSVDTTTLERLLGYILRRGQLAAFQEYARAAEPYAITPAQFSVMTVVAANPGVSQIALATALAIEPSRVVALLNALEQRGAAVRARSKFDRRSHGIFLTKQGLELLEDLTALVDESDRRVSARLTAKERDTLATLLGKLY